MPPEELADHPGFHPSPVKLPDVFVDPLDLFADDRRRLRIIQQIRPPQGHLEGLANMVAEDGELLDVPFDLLERLLPEALILFSLGDVPAGRLNTDHFSVPHDR